MLASYVEVLQTTMKEQQLEIKRLWQVVDHLVQAHSSLRRDHACLHAQHQTLLDGLGWHALFPQPPAPPKLSISRDVGKFDALLSSAKDAAHKLVVFAGIPPSSSLAMASRCCMRSLAGPLWEATAANGACQLALRPRGHMRRAVAPVSLERALDMCRAALPEQQAFAGSCNGGPFAPSLTPASSRRCSDDATLWTGVSSSAAEEAPLQGSSPSAGEAWAGVFTALLAEMWMNGSLADAFWSSLGNAATHEFRACSRAADESARMVQRGRLPVSDGEALLRFARGGSCGSTRAKFYSLDGPDTPCGTDEAHPDGAQSSAALETSDSGAAAAVTAGADAPGGAALPVPGLGPVAAEAKAAAAAAGEGVLEASAAALPLGAAPTEPRGPPCGGAEELLVVKPPRPGTVWEVVGGCMQRGLIVRRGKYLNSPIIWSESTGPWRLSIGVRLLQVQLEDGRLRFFKLAGDGPDSGWVSTHSLGVPLLRIPSH
mmetsp:Transcript_30922/g.91928  ORF Transcript_30922/g.91928 Transcript_30922/m.91928 type:complete len:487 (+) Transcript_30922:83-1543(+)